MNPLTRTRRWLDYLAGGLACGLGGVFPALLLIIVCASQCLFHLWLLLHGLERSRIEAWLWSGIIGGIERTPPFALLNGLATLLALAFAYGWWVGMHRRSVPGKVAPQSSRTR